MTGTTPPSVLSQIVELSQLDVLLAGLQQQKKTAEAELQKRPQAIKTVEQRKNARQKLLDEKKALYNKEEKGLKFERDKLVERRKALGTLGTVKLQQAGEREIEYTSKQLNGREEMLLGLLTETSAIEKEAADLNQGLGGLQTELAAFQKDAEETLERIKSRTAEYTEQRQKIAREISNPGALTIYNRVKDRYPTNPIVKLINNDSCSGCFMRVGPQVFVQASRGEIVKCPGCGRIVQLSDEAAA